MRRILLALVLLAVTAGPVAAHPPFQGRVTQWYSAHHRGIDIAARYGTPIHSIGPGTVVFAGWKRNCGGWQVYIRATDGHHVTYNHLSRIYARRGEKVTTATVIGRVGRSGIAPPWLHHRCTTGPHVHIGVWIGYPWHHGSYRINPKPFIWDRHEPDRR